MRVRSLFAFAALVILGCSGDTFVGPAGVPGAIAGAGGSAAGVDGGAGTAGLSAGEGGASGSGSIAGAGSGNAPAAGAAGEAGLAGAAGLAGSGGLAGGGAGNGGAGNGGVGGARACEAVAQCPEPTIRCQLPACVDGLCTTTPLDGVPCGDNQMCQQGVCVCACAKGTVAGMPGCLAPDLVVEPAAASAVFDGKREISFHPTLLPATAFSLTASFPQPVLLAGLTLDISGTGAAGKQKFAARYEVLGDDPDGARTPIGAVDVVHENGDHVLVDVPVVSGSYIAIELRISTPVPLPADAGFTDVAIYEITTNLCP